MVTGVAGSASGLACGDETVVKRGASGNGDRAEAINALGGLPFDVIFARHEQGRSASS